MDWVVWVSLLCVGIALVVVWHNLSWGRRRREAEIEHVRMAEAGYEAARQRDRQRYEAARENRSRSMMELHKKANDILAGAQEQQIHHATVGGAVVWRCPHCGKKQKAPLTPKGNTSWSPRICARCKVHLQLVRKDGTKRFYTVKKKPALYEVNRLELLMGEHENE